MAVAACQMPPTEVRLQTVDRSQTVLPGDFLEANMDMQRLGSVIAEFSTSGQLLSWNVHSHEPGLIIHDEGQSATDTIVFVADQDGPVSIVWVNGNSSPVDLTVTLHFAGEAWLLSWD